MSAVLQELVSLLRLAPLNDDQFLGESQDLGWGQVFGGQVLGQALSAAAQTVDSARQVHSLQSYFLRPGDAAAPILYEVDRIRDGTSFTTRRVVATQQGKAIFHLSASFQRPEEGFCHGATMPEVPAPALLQSELELWRSYAERLPPRLKARVLADRPIELRPVDPVDPFAPTVRAPQHAVWMRATAVLPDDEALHRCLLAYCSDFNFITTALRPHGATWVSPSLQVASLDHVMWFHQPLRIDQWLLHVMESPSASGARGFARGQVFDQEGMLVASTAQEGLMRPRSALDP